MRARKPDVISDLWYKSAVIYNCDVRTYLDANGDGVGDFRGLQRRLDYLAGLGITAIWLMPFYPSPDRDDGYDITDYYNVDSRYALVIVAAKRARQINDYHHQLGEGIGFEQAPPPLVESRSKNYLTMSLEEISEGKLKYSYAK